MFVLLLHLGPGIGPGGAMLGSAAALGEMGITADHHGD